METGIELISKERLEQITKHGRTIGRDVLNNDENQLSNAASILSLEDYGCNELEDMIADHCPAEWDKAIWRKMMEKPYKERLIIAGALIAAEIDRLQAIEK